MDKKKITEKNGYSPAEDFDDGWDDLEIEDLDVEADDTDDAAEEIDADDIDDVDTDENDMDIEETGDDYEEYDDEGEDTAEDDDAEDALGRKEKRLRVSIHLVLGILILGILGLCFYKYKTFGNRITQEDIDAIPTPDNPEIETYDYFTANPMQDDGTFPEDDVSASAMRLLRMVKTATAASAACLQKTPGLLLTITPWRTPCWLPMKILLPPIIPWMHSVFPT